MGTTHLGFAMPYTLQQVKKILLNRGFTVQVIPTPDPVIVAHKKGNWFRKEVNLVFELKSVSGTLTQIDITSLNSYTEGYKPEADKFERSFASALYNYFRKVIHAPYGI
jgi:hypothetical protein